MNIGPALTSETGRLQFQSLPGAPPREWFSYYPVRLEPTTPVLVFVHGISRRAAEFVYRLRAAADERQAIVIAPLFRKEAFGQYQQLVDPVSGVRADLAMLDILDAVGRETGADTARFYLAGVSGGAQFAHRFAWAHPERLRGLGLLAAGWYTWPDAQMPYPLGLLDLPGGRTAEPNALNGLPIEVFVGDRDIARDETLRRCPEIDRLQGRNRLQRAKAWTEAMGRAGSGATPNLTVIPGAGHNLGAAFVEAGLDRLMFRRLGLSGA